MSTSTTLEEHTLIRLSYNILATVNAVQFDTNREFYFVIDDYEVPEDAELRVYVVKPSGKEIYNYAVLANGEIVVQPTMQMLAEEGDCYGQIQIIVNGAVVSSFPFLLTVAPALYPKDFTSKDEYTIIDELIEQSRYYIAQMEIAVEQEKQRVENENNRISEFNWMKTFAKLATLHAREAGSYAEEQGSNVEALYDSVDEYFKNVEAQLDEIMQIIEDSETGQLIMHIYEYIDETIKEKYDNAFGEDLVEPDVSDIFDGTCILYTPFVVHQLYYTGEEQSPLFGFYDTTRFTIGGDTSATDIGTYTTTFTPNEGYYWAGNTTETREVVWTLDSFVVDIPVQSEMLVYNGQAQYPEFDGNNPECYDISGLSEEINAGIYTFTVTLNNENYIWSDGTTDDKEIIWEIQKFSIETPSQNGTLIYNGVTQSPEFNNYDSNILSMVGETSHENAGTYTVIFTIIADDNYCWNDGTEGSKSVSWTIEKASCNFVLSSYDVEIELGGSVTITYSRDGNGAVSCINANEWIDNGLTITISSDSITFTKTSQAIYNDYSFTIVVEETDNYLEASATVNIEIGSGLHF